MFKTPKFIVAVAFAFYAVGLIVAWQLLDARSERRIQTVLEAAERGYSDVIDGEIEAALRYVGGAAVNILDGRCTAQPQARMEELARMFNIDEINLVDSRGIVIGSNIPSVLGFDFGSHQLTREFLSLTNSLATRVTQPFRPGIANPDMCCKYYGMCFPGHDGFLQLGITEDRLRQNMYSYTSDEAEQILRDWHFSVVGWYERADKDGEFAPGRIVRRWSAERGERLVGRYFYYHSYRYLALLPESYCQSQRNAAFAVIAAVLGAILIIVSFVLVRLARTSVTLERMHAAADARTAADLALARTIQMSALPAAEGAFAEHMEFSLVAECRPAREVGGDFYDFFPMPDGRIAFVVADVSGKGIPGALFMMEAKNVLKSCLTAFSDLADAVAEANRRLTSGNRAEMFVTVWIGLLDGRGTFEYVNAGHNRPLVRHADGTIDKLMGKGGLFLGMFEDAAYRSELFRFAPGDVLYLYTDGITEAMNAKGELFGERRFRDEIAAGRPVMPALVAFSAGTEQSDDMTGMAIFWHGAGEPRVREFAADEASYAPALKFVRDSLAGVDATTVAAMLNAADEVVTNIVSYSGAKGYRIAVDLVSDRVRLVFSDDGATYNPLSHADPDTHVAIEDLPVGGLGLMMVKRLAHRVAYSRTGARNVLTLIRRRGPET